jgi:hypothetical protein
LALNNNHGRWFSPGTPASSTTKTGRHDIAEILLKVELNTKNHHQIILMILLIPTSVRPAKVLAHGGGSLRVLRLPPPLKLVAMI